MSEAGELPQQADEQTHRLSVLLVGQHALVREGLRRLLERDGSLEVLAEAGSREQALRALQRLQPDLALIEMSLPTRLGIDVAHAIQAHRSATRVVALLLEGNESYQAPLHAAGARVILHRGYGPELLIALHAAWRDATSRKP